MACRDFIIHSQGEDGYVEVSSSDTLFEVRRLILEDFDPEQLPSSSSSSNNEKSDCAGETGSCPEFAFRVNGIWISAKQECRKNAFELLERKARVELVPKKQQQPAKRRAYESLLDNDHNASGNVKCARMVGEGGAVTPSLGIFLQQKDDDATEEERVSKLLTELKRKVEDVNRGNPPMSIHELVGLHNMGRLPRNKEVCYNRILRKDGNCSAFKKCPVCKSGIKSSIGILTSKDLMQLMELMDTRDK